MKTNITIIVLIVAAALMFIGAGFFSFAHYRRSKRIGGFYCCLFVKYSDSEIKLIKTGTLLIILGILIFIIINPTPGSTLKWVK